MGRASPPNREWTFGGGGGMIAIYSVERANLARLKELVGGDASPVEGWREFERTAVRGACSVVAAEWLPANPVVPHLVAFKERYPRHPVVLVTRWNMENARELRHLVVEEVVWLREAGIELREAVGRVCAGRPNPVRCFATAFAEAEHLPVALRKALALTCRTEAPVRSVKQLATSVGCDRRTLSTQWSRAVGARSSLRLQDFLHWVLLIRARTRKSPGRSWRAVAEELGVHADTLARFARQLTGGTLGELAAANPAWLARSFEAQVVGPLMPGAVPGEPLRAPPGKGTGPGPGPGAPP